tara:strand:- start:2192 stop:2395 length:204 start_codon:yes stop_codon:yes gene_type:complete
LPGKNKFDLNLKGIFYKLISSDKGFTFEYLILQINWCDLRVISNEKDYFAVNFWKNKRKTIKGSFQN